MSDEQEHGSYGRIKRDLFVAGTIGAVAAATIAAASSLMGYVGDVEARRLVEAIIPTTRLFCSATMTTSATILALMLTMIGLGHQADTELSDGHYQRIVKIALYDAILFGASVVMFILHCVPVHESDSLPEWWYPTIYYGVLATSSVLAGASIAIVTLLYLAVHDVVQVVALGHTEHCYAGADGSSGNSQENQESCPADKSTE